MIVTGCALQYVHTRRIGAEVALHALLVHLRSRGHTVSVVTTQKTPHGRVDGVPVAMSVPVRRVPSDVVLVNAGLAGKARQWWPHTHLVVWAHNNQLPTLLDVKAVLSRGNATLLTNTRHMRDVYRSVIGYDSHVLHPPVGRAPRVDGGTAVTLINCSPDKGSDVFWSLAEANPDRDFIAVRGGYGKQDIRDLPNVDVVDHGDLEPVWARTRILLLPSRHESYSMTGVEAAARGIPAIAADHPGVREALGHGALFGSDWQAALDQVDAAWDEYATNALIHSAGLTGTAELDRTADLIEAFGGV